MSWWTHGEAVRERLLSLGASVWAMSFAGLALSHLSRGARLRAEWAEAGSTSYLECLRLSLQHATVSHWLPFKSGELGYPWLLHRRWGIAWSDATASLVWLRLQDAGVLAWLTAGSLSALLAWRSGVSWGWMIGLPLSVLGTGLMIGVLLMRKAPRLIALWQQRCHDGSRFLALTKLLSRSLARARGETWRWCVASWACKLLALAGLLVALTDLTAPSAWLAAVSGEISAALPLQAPAGFGSYEAAVALAAGVVADAPMGDLLTAALAVHLFTLAGTLLLTLGVSAVPRRMPRG